MQPPLLSARDLAIGFKTDTDFKQVVNGVNFDVLPGEMLAIVGESGSGKSVSCLSLLQLLPLQATVKGKLLFRSATLEADLATMTEKQIRQVRGRDIAMIFQEPMTSLNPVLTCGYQVMETLQRHEGLSRSEAREKAMALFEQVKLPDPKAILDRYPHQLSGGQKQRVMIAMAISCKPALLIADEPTTALDVTVQQTILELIKDLQRAMGMSVILVTHDLGLVADVADRVVVMYKGEVVEQGATAAVLQQPQHAYTKALLSCRPAVHQRGERLPVVSDFLQPGIPPAKTFIHPLKDILPNHPVPVSTPALQVENVKVYFPGRGRLFGKTGDLVKAVDDVSFSVARGETVGLVGESGCGKTTLGRAILQLQPVTSGRILLEGKDLAGLSKSAMQPLRKELQIVFQDPYGSLNPRLTIGSAMVEPMKVHSIGNNATERKDMAISLLEKVNLSATHFNAYPHQFSGGQRQRICIARALALNPSFLVFDESVSALDVSVQAQVLNLLNDLKKEFGFTSIFISHDLSVVRYISDRIIVMNKGRIVEEGPADAVYNTPGNEYTKKLVSAIPGKKLNRR